MGVAGRYTMRYDVSVQMDVRPAQAGPWTFGVLNSFEYKVHVI